MARRSKFLACLLTGHLALALSGCSGEPDESEMRDAMGKHPQFQLLLLAISKGKEDQVPQTLAKSKIEKFSCVAAKEAPGYVCDFRWGLPVNGTVEYGAPQKRRFFKGAGGWMMDIS